MKDCALVLEGGALRGVFTSGALDVLMEQDLYLPYVIGVSAGSLNAFGYLSRQIGRSGRSNIEYARDPRYLGLKNLVQKRSIFNFDFMFGELSHDLLPFDYDAFFASPIRFVAVATDCETGRPFYYEKKPGRDETIFDAAVASSSMPLFAPPKKLLGRDYLDGGVAMPIAFEKAEEDGFHKQVLVLTRHKGYRKKPLGNGVRRLYRRTFRDKPEFLQALLRMPEHYNQLMDEIDQREQAGDFFVIRPRKPVTISRLEKNESKLKSLYLDGKMDTLARLAELKQFLGVD